MGWDGLRWVEMDFLFHLTTFITANMNHQSESAESRYNLLVLCFFHIISPWLVNLRVLFESMSIHSLGHFSHTEVGWSRDWQEAPQSGATRSGQLQRTFSVEFFKCSNEQKHFSRGLVVTGAIGGVFRCHFCHVSGPRWRYLEVWKRRRLQGPGCFLGIKNPCLKSSLPNGHLKWDKWVTHSDTSKWHKWWHNSWNSAFPCKSSNSWRVVSVPRPMTRKVRWWMRPNMQATWRLVIVLGTKQRSLKWSCGWIQILWCFFVVLCAWHAKGCKGVLKHWIWIPRSLKVSMQPMPKAVKDKRVVFWRNLGHLIPVCRWTF